MPKQAQYYVYGVIMAGGLALAASLAGGLGISSPLTSFVYIALAIVASMFKMRVPGMEGTYSLNTLFILFGLYYLSPAETMVAGCAAVAVQSYWKAQKRPTAVQLVFNLANVALSIWAAFSLTNIALLRDVGTYRPALMAAAAFVHFVVNTLIVSGVLSLLGGKSLREVWEPWYQWSLPYYLIAAALVGLLPFGGHSAPPEAWLILLPLLYLVRFFYGLSLPGHTPPGSATRPGAEAGGSAVVLPPAARFYAGAVLCLGGTLLARAVFTLDAAADTGRFLACLGLGMLVSTWKVRLPGMQATVSVGFVVTLFAISVLPFSQAMVVSAALSAVQVLWKPKATPSTLQSLFSVASLVISAALAYGAVQGGFLPGAWAQSAAATLAIGTVVLFSVNTVMVSAVVCLAAAKPLSAIWQACYFWAFPITWPARAQPG